jgi:hypothetical protein
MLTGIRHLCNHLLSEILSTQLKISKNLSLIFPQWRWCMSVESLNKAVHVLAKCAISQLLNNTWVGECPSFIKSVVAAV